MMNIIRPLLLVLFILIINSGYGQTYFVKDSNINTTENDYKASRFGIKSDGRTLNTNSIQKAIDFINARGGGRLVFYVGRYLTGSIQLKSNVVIHLEEGAVLVSSGSIYDYTNNENRSSGLVSAVNIKNSGITGKGVIEGNGEELVKNVKDQSAKGFREAKKINIPSMINMEGCENVLLSVQNYIDVAAEAIKLQNCSDVTIDSAAIKIIRLSENTNPAITVSNCQKVLISNCFIDAGAPYIKIISNQNDLKLINVVTSEGNRLTFKNNAILSGK